MVCMPMVCMPMVCMPMICMPMVCMPMVRLFVTEEIQYHGGLRSRELGQAPILLCVPNS